MKAIMLIVLGLALAGCSAQPRTIVSQNLDDAVVGVKPAGYPVTSIKPLPDQPGFCVAVTENWKQRDHDGQPVWLKEKTVQSISCTKQRWYRLARDY